MCSRSTIVHLFFQPREVLISDARNAREELNKIIHDCAYDNGDQLRQHVEHHSQLLKSIDPTFEVELGFIRSIIGPYGFEVAKQIIQNVLPSKTQAVHPSDMRDGLHNVLQSGWRKVLSSAAQAWHVLCRVPFRRPSP